LGGCESAHGGQTIFFFSMVQCTTLQQNANITIFLLFSWALYYIRTIIIIDGDLTNMLYIKENVYIIHAQAYIVGFTVINLLAIL